MKKENIPTLWTAKEWREFLRGFPDSMQIEFLDENTSLPLHILCPAWGYNTYAGHSKNSPNENRVSLYLRENLQSTIARKAGSVSTKKKAAAARENGKKGGRPRQL